MDALLIARLCVATAAGAVLGWRCGGGLGGRDERGVLARALALLALASAMFAATSSAVGEPEVPVAGLTGTTLVLLAMGVVLGASAAASGTEPRWIDRLRLGGSVAGSVALGGLCVDGAWLPAALLMTLGLVPTPRRW